MHAYEHSGQIGLVFRSLGHLVRLSFTTKATKSTKESEGETLPSIFVLFVSFVLIPFHQQELKAMVEAHRNLILGA